MSPVPDRSREIIDIGRVSPLFCNKDIRVTPVTTAVGATLPEESSKPYVGEYNQFIATTCALPI
jgi:hypothetical protein